MPMNDSPQQLHFLRAYILRFFMADGAKQTGDLLRVPEMQCYDRRYLRHLVYGMALAGLLETWGRTSGAWFMTSRLGFVVLVTLEHEYLADKHKRSR